MQTESKANMAQFLGEVISGRYRLDQYLAEGNFGAVYRATQLAYGVPLRDVALKVSKRPMSNAEARKTFGDALLMAKVTGSTPNAALRDHFVTVYDAGLCADCGPLANHPYLAMEYVDGGSIGQLLKSGPFPLKTCLDFFDQILAAVTFMHNGLPAPVAHRDLKPDNFLVAIRPGAPRLVKVTDFGLAVEVDTLLGWVESGGDLAYLAPESFSHNISSPQSDVYMLGLVFYEMLTNTNPFSAVGVHLKGDDEEKRAELRRLHLQARQMETFPLLAKNVELQFLPALVQVIRDALDPDMVTRKFRTAGELKAAWDKARTKTGPEGEKRLQPWEKVRRLLEEAEQNLAVGDKERGESLLQQAMAINRDKAQVPDSMVSGAAYLRMVKKMLAGGQTREAGLLAYEGYNRRKCRTTSEAVAEYYRAIGSPLAAGFEKESQTARDRE